MNRNSRVPVWTLVLLPALQLLCPGAIRAQGKIAAFQQSLAENQQRLRQFQWVETTVITIDGEEQSIVQKLCVYQPDGTIRKQEIHPSPQDQTPGGLTGKISAKKKEAIIDYMQQAVALLHQYVPPDAQRLRAGDITLKPAGGGSFLLQLPNVVKPGDSLSFFIDSASNAIQKLNVKSYLVAKKDPVGLDVTFAMGEGGINYAATIILVAPAKRMQVTVQNANYQPAGSALGSK
jgi:hypothetical protein